MCPGKLNWLVDTLPQYPYGHQRMKIVYSRTNRNRRKIHEFSFELLEKHHEADTWTFKRSSYQSATWNVVVYGILLAPLIPCYEDETFDSVIASLKVDDADFAAECGRATAYNVFLHQEADYESLREILHDMPCSLYDLPFHDYVRRNFLLY